MQSPDIRFVRRDEASLAFQVFGAGPDLLVLPGFVSHLEQQWQFELTARFLRRLGSFARVCAMDRRGSGLSERLSPQDLPPLEVLVDDLCAVLDAVDVRRTSVLAWADGAMQALLFAAMHPERVERLILFAPAACGSARPDYPWQYDEDDWAAYLAEIREGWGSTAYFQTLADRWWPSVARDPAMVRQMTSYFRGAVNATAAETLERLYSETDVRDVLPLVAAPTLVLHRTDDLCEPVGQGRFIAEQVPDGRFLELPGADAAEPWAGDQDAVLGPIEEFLTGRRRQIEADRVLATVMLTDIVDSTGLATRLGDQRWAPLVAEHYERARAIVGAYGGRLVETRGDGVLAAFDGPARSVRCALELHEAMEPLGLTLRGACHTGEVQVARGQLHGLAVHVAARIAAAAGPGEVWVSSTVRDLTAGSGLTFADAGEHDLRGVPDRWRLFRVADGL